MKIQLYLKNINQEMIDTGRLVSGPGSSDAWVVSWPKSCCILDFSLGSMKDKVISPAKRGYLLRKEKEGGMFWDPRTGAVYKVDEQAYHAMLDLDQGVSEREVARRMKVSLQSVKALTAQLQRITK